MIQKLARKFLFSPFFLIFFFSIYPVSDTDFGWHLRTGEYIFNSHTAPRMFLFSFANSDYHYTHYSWAAELVTYIFYKFFGLWGVTLFFAMVLTVSIIILIKTSLIFTKKELFLPYFVALTPLAHAISGGRTIVFGLLFFSLIYYFFEKSQKFKSKSFWLIPLVFLFWANFHASFAVGIALIILLLILNLIVPGSNSKITLKTSFVLIILSTLATLINPYTISIWSQSVLITAKEFSNFQTDNPGWASPFTLGGPGIIYILVISTLIVLIFFSRKVELSHKISIFVIFILTLSTLRFLFVLLVFIVPAIYILFLEFKKRQNLQTLNSFQVKLSLLALFSTLTLLIVKNLSVAKLAYSSFDSYTNYLSLYSPNKKYYKDWSPKAYAFFKDNLKNKNVLTDANWGGLFILDEPKTKVFYYGAVDNFVINGKPFSFEYLSLVNTTGDWQEKLERYKVEVIFLAPSYSLVEKLKNDPGWQRVYEDNLATILVRI